MTNAKVGVENLPNVFISQISLENNNTESFKVEIDIELWDFLENDSNPNSFLWSEDDVFSDFHLSFRTLKNHLIMMTRHN